MAETVKHIAGLIQGKDEIKQVDGKGSPKNALKSGAPAESPPGTCLRFANGLAGHSAPARAQSKSDEGKKQNARGELGKKRTRQAYGKYHGVLPARVLPCFRKAPQ